jgi:3-oxoacyl-[acyl-carrier protein] reductase
MKILWRIIMSNNAVLITGASRGIGKAIAIELARNGFGIGVHYFSNQDGAKETIEEITKLGGSAISLYADVGNENDVKSMVKTFTEHFDTVFGLVNNAGVYNRIGFNELTLETWENTLRTNLTSAYLVTKELLPYIQPGGRIVNISSILAHTGSNYGADYAASKAGLIGFTKSLARELVGKNILVNAVAPGAIDTRILADDSPKRREKREAEIPLQRIGNVEEIAAGVALLFSKNATYITGEVLNINGGLLMH